jgi:SAM-dependent methyltransferase
MTEATTGLPIERASAASLLERVDQTIHPRCEMHAYALTRLDEEPAREYYLDAAHYLVTRLQAFLEEEGTVLETASMLDFAAGYGRFTRFFVHMFSEVQVSDRDPEMLAFIGEHFGADGFLSSPDPDAIPSDRRFDVVFCFSLFTQRPASVWTDWLRVLSGLVEKGGLLIFSTRSPALATSLAGASRSDDAVPFAFVDGVPRAAIARPLQPEDLKAISLDGLLLSAEAGAEGVIQARVPVRTDSRWWIEQAFLQPNEVPGLSTGPVSVEPVGSSGNWDAVQFRIPFYAQTSLRDVPIGKARAILHLSRPDAVEVEDPAEGANIDGQPDFQFVMTNETSGRLEPETYGSTTVTDAFVRRAASQVGTLEFVRHFSGGEFDRYQDIYAFRRC